MHLELVTIGDEILRGKTLNTNACFLARHLHQNGYSVSSQTTVSDERSSLLKGLTEALARSDVVIATGGLGPTLDDGTREIAAQIFNSEFYFNAHLAEDLKHRYQERYFAVEDQARLPIKATMIPNRVGSAVGLIFSEEKKTLILLPGVPREMEPMFLEGVLPFFKQHYPGLQRGTERLCFCLIYESLVDPYLRALSIRYPQVEVGIYPAFGTLTVLLTGSSSQELFSFAKELQTQFDSYCYQSPNGNIEEALYQCLTQKKFTLACAESCTGGHIAASITSIPGSSDYFLGSLVTYSDHLKEHLLGVSKHTLLHHGAVSEQTVTEMLEGVFKQTEADYGIAVSGIAGPSGSTATKPVGTIYAALGKRGEKPDVGHFMVSGSREKITLVAAQCLIGALWRKIEKGISAFPLVDLSKHLPKKSNGSSAILDKTGEA